MKTQWAPDKTPLSMEDLGPRFWTGYARAPWACGIKRANWTHMTLADFLLLKPGIRVCKPTMDDVNRCQGVRLYQPADRFMREDPVRQQQLTLPS